MIRFPSPFVRLPDEIVAIISSYFVIPISLSFKKDILSYLKINDIIIETPLHSREELYNKILFWLNIQRILHMEENIHPVEEINLLLFSSARPESWINPVYKRQFYHMHGMFELSKKFFYYINNNAFTHFGEKPNYFTEKLESKIRTIWGLFTDRERLQFLIILPFFVTVDSEHVFQQDVIPLNPVNPMIQELSDIPNVMQEMLTLLEQDNPIPTIFHGDTVIEGNLVVHGDTVIEGNLFVQGDLTIQGDAFFG